MTVHYSLSIQNFITLKIKIIFGMFYIISKFPNSSRKVSLMFKIFNFIVFFKEFLI